MIVLTLVFCLATAPGVCQKVSPQEYNSGIACLLDAQQVAAEWKDEHPGYVLKNMRCGPLEKET